MDNKVNPKVTVLMTVYNGERWLREAMDSILTQTFTDFEFLIINDGSTDNSVAIINSYQDHRIKLVNQENQGIALALNKGLSLARGEYIAKMDDDDISLPKRLEVQVKYMDSHPDVGICGTNIYLINEIGGGIGEMHYPLTHKDVKATTLFSASLAHPTTIFRRSMFIDYNLAYPNFKIGVDYGLWFRASKVLKMVNLKQKLLKYRFKVGISHKYRETERENVNRFRKGIIEELGEFNEAELEVFYNITDSEHQVDQEYLESLVGLFAKIRDYNKEKKIYDKKSLDYAIATKYLLVAGRMKKRDLIKNKFFIKYSFIYFFRLRLSNQLYLLKKLIRKKRV